jgi:hypothetical protein
MSTLQTSTLSCREITQVATGYEQNDSFLFLSAGRYPVSPAAQPTAAPPSSSPERRPSRSPRRRPSRSRDAAPQFSWTPTLPRGPPCRSATSPLHGLAPICRGPLDAAPTPSAYLAKHHQNSRGVAPPGSFGAEQL